MPNVFSPLKLQQPFSAPRLWLSNKACSSGPRGGVKELVRVTYVPLNGFPSVLPSYSWNVSLIVPLRVTFSTEQNHWLVTILARKQFVEAQTPQLVSSFCKWTSAKWDCGLPSLASSSLSVRSDCSDPPSLLLSPSSSSSESSASTRGCQANQAVTYGCLCPCKLKVFLFLSSLFTFSDHLRTNSIFSRTTQMVYEPSPLWPSSGEVLCTVSVQLNAM